MSFFFCWEDLKGLSRNQRHGKESYTHAMLLQAQVMGRVAGLVDESYEDVCDYTKGCGYTNRCNIAKAAPL